MRGDWDPCLTRPCNHGVCLRHESTFTCECEGGWTGTFCSERRAPHMLDWTVGGWEFYALILLLLLALVCATLLILVCRRRNRRSHIKPPPSAADSRSDRLPSDDLTNPLVPTTPRIVPPIYQNTVERRPPPRPPKTGRVVSRTQPTSIVRPMRSGDGIRGDHTPQLSTCGGGGKGSLGSISALNGAVSHYDDAYEAPPKPAPPPHRFLMTSEENCALLARGVIAERSIAKK